MEEERRSASRCFSVFNVTVRRGAGTCRAELRDVSPAGLGLCWIRGDGPLREKEPVVIDLPVPGGGTASVSGRITEYVPAKNGIPNARSAAVELDETSEDGPCARLANRIQGAPTPPAPSASAAGPLSVGLLRAWNDLGDGKHAVVKSFFEELQSSGGVGKIVADNLLTDSNCPAKRLENLMRVMYDTRKARQSDAPLSVLEASFEAYRQSYTMSDLDCDRRISPDKVGPLVSRVLPGRIVRSWVTNPADQLLAGRDLIKELLDNEPGSLNNFREAVESQTEAPNLGRSDTDVVWCAPRDETDRCRDSRLDCDSLLAALGVTWRDKEVLELFYPPPDPDEKSPRKPCSVHAGVGELFRLTPEEEEFGRTPGVGSTRGLREAVHGPLRVAEALRDGAGLRPWR